MRKAGMMMGLALAAIACASGADMMGEVLDSGVPDAGAQPGDGSGLEFVGYSSQAVRQSSNSQPDFNGGLFDLYAACTSEFGAEHRVCTKQEILNTPDLPPSLGQDEFGGWIAVWVFESGENQACLNQGDRGPTLWGSGHFSTERCDQERRVACCGPR